MNYTKPKQLKKSLFQIIKEKGDWNPFTITLNIVSLFLIMIIIYAMYTDK